MFADENIHFPEIDKKYECDISIVCTNLYDNTQHYPSAIINRKILLDDLI